MHTALQKSHWQHFRRPPGWLIERPWRDWLFHDGSLTQRLITTSRGQFEVKVTREGWRKPLPNEAKALQMQPREYAWIREVELHCFGEAWVIARSIIPAQTLTGTNRRLKHLGSRPLGAFLFKNRSMRRGNIQVSSHSSGWGRRSVFYLQEHPLLVSEFFLPVVVSSRNALPSLENNVLNELVA